jgi:hypothetical protein
MHPALRYSYYNRGTAGVEGVTPTQQAHSLVVSDKTETTETLTFLNPGAAPDGYLIVVSTSEVDQFPVDGTPYTVGQDLGSGNLVAGIVLSSEALTLTVLNLTAGTTYYYRIFAYNGSGTGIKYRVAPERGHRWVTDSAPATGRIGTSINRAKTLEVRTGGTKVDYRTRATVNDTWGSWAEWDDIALGEFHSCKICEGDHIQNAAGDPVAMKLIVADHSGSGKAYAGYVPGDNMETIFTGANSQKWNDVDCDEDTGDVMLGADAGTNRLATLTNARTVSYNLTMDGNVIASVCATGYPAIPWLICFKNPGTSGKGIAALISGTWTLRDTTVGKNYHMIRKTPGLGGSATRVCCSSADGTGNDFIWSDDYFATRTTVDITGEYGAFAFDDENIVLALFSRTAGADLQVTVDGSNFDASDNPVANIVMFNGVSDGNGFNVCASSGTSLGIKSTPSNITSAETRTNLYANYIAKLTSIGADLPSDNKVRDLVWGLQDLGIPDADVLTLHVSKSQTDIESVKIDIGSPNRTAMSVVTTGAGTVTLTAGVVNGGGTACFDTKFTPSIDCPNQDNVYVFAGVYSNVDGAQWDLGVTGTPGATQRWMLNSRTSNTLVTALNCGQTNCTGTFATSVGRHGVSRTGSTADAHDVDKNGTEVDGSNAARTGAPDRTVYWLGHHPDNTHTPNLLSTRDGGYFGVIQNMTLAKRVGLDALLAAL